MKKILYGIGILLVFVMVLGLAINYIGMWIGVAKPLNSGIILVTFWFSVVCFLGINKKRIYNWIKSLAVNRQPIPKSVYALVLLPIMAIAGAELFNTTGSNIILMVMLPLIVVVPIICMFTKLIPKKYWAFAIWMMALSIILHRTLISPYLSGTDNIIELMVFKATYYKDIWNSTGVMFSEYNTVLSVTILPVMISKITFISPVWVFKLVLPILLSFVPVAIYELVKDSFNEKIAFLSAFFLMSVYTYYTVTIMTEKQLIATFLLSIFFLVLFNNIKWKPFVLGLLGVGIIFSHYATAVLFVALFIGVAIILRKKYIFIVACLMAVITVVWYKVQGNGVVVSQFTTIGQSVIAATNSSYNVGQDGITNEVVRLFTKGTAYLPPLLIVLYVISQIMIVVSFVILAWRHFIKKIRDVRLEYLALACMLLMLLGLELVLPKLSDLIGLERIYLYCMMVLSPLVFIAISRFKKWWLIASVVFVSLFFLMNIGFINQLINKPLSDSISLSNNADYPVFTTKEMQGAQWLLDNSTNQEICSDNYAQYVFYYSNISITNISRVDENVLVFKLENEMPVVINDIPQGSFIYLRKSNLVNDDLTLHYYNVNVEGTIAYPMDDLGNFKKLLDSSKVVYSNSDCQILQTTADYQGNQ